MKRNWLRGIAIALIVLPEPFTSPIGAILLLVSYILPKRHKDSFSNLESLVRRYLQYKETTGLSRSAISKPPVFHRLNWDVRSQRIRRAKDYVTDNRSPNVNRVNVVPPHVTAWHEYVDKKIRAEFQYRYITDSCKVSNKVIHHVLRNSVPQFTALSLTNNKIKHHTIKTTLQPAAENVNYSGLRPVVTLAKPKVVHHSLKRH